MQKTNRLYYDNASLTAFDATVIALREKDGKWEDIGFTVKDGEIVLDKRLECYEIIVLKVW